MSTNYWNERFLRYGHTGWANQAIYFYDQFLRLRLVREEIMQLGFSPNFKCLDYGCGVGDFSRMLSTLGGRVVAYDLTDEIVSAARIRDDSSSAFYTSKLSETLESSPFDLVLSITVLQHILDDAALQGVIDNLAGSLVEGGCMLVIETTGEPNASSSHVRLRTKEMWERFFMTASLKLREAKYIYHPALKPTHSFQEYSSKWIVKTLRVASFLRFPFAGLFLAKIAKKAAECDKDYFVDSGSPTLLMVWQK